MAALAVEHAGKISLRDVHSKARQIEAKHTLQQLRLSVAFYGHSLASQVLNSATIKARLSLLIFRNAIEVVSAVRAAKLFDEVFVVSDHHQLEVALLRTR